jgi:hypothetical protein
MAKRKIYLATSLIGQTVGVREEDDGRWLVSFLHLDLGFIERDRTFTPASASGAGVTH